MTELTNTTVSVLVVDNDQETCNSVIDILRAQGFSCVAAADAASALRYTKTRVPSLVIANIDIDGLDSSRFSDALRDLHPSDEIPFIYISDSHDKNLIERCREAGGMYFLTKPFDPSVLVELVDKSLWMPHLVRRHIDVNTHKPDRKGPRVLGISKTHRV